METGVTKELIDDLKEMLIKNEGMELKPYQCTSDKTTIGVGRNLTDNGITIQEAELLLLNDMDGVFNDLIETYLFGNHALQRQISSCRYVFQSRD